MLNGRKSSRRKSTGAESLTREKVIQVLREGLLHLSSAYGVRRIGLFGSYAKGVATETSDVGSVPLIKRLKPIDIIRKSNRISYPGFRLEAEMIFYL